MRGKLSVIAFCLGFFVAFILHQTLLGKKTPIDTKSLNPTKKIDENGEKTKVGIKIIQETKTQSKQLARRQKAHRRTITASKKLIEHGKKMVGNRGELIGEFPEVTARYRSTLGFSNYIKLMKKIGGRFFIFDKENRRLVAEIDFDSKGLKPLGDLSNLSPRSREISGEPEISRYKRLAEAYYGPCTYSMVLLLPMNIDCFLIAGIEQYLKGMGLANKDFISFDGIYRRQGNDLILEILSGKLRSGKVKTINARFNLTKASNI